MNASIDFVDLLRSAAAGYLPRPAIERALAETLASRPAGMIVLRGEPGAGKTSLVATQVEAGRGLHHFLRRGHTEYRLWRDPYGFLTSVGFQLKARFGESLFPSTVAIDVDQRVHLLVEGTSLTGIHVQRLVSVPWRQARLQVRQEVGQAPGRATGVYVEEMVEEYHRIPLQVFREMALIDPLRRLKTERPDERLVLWVDALDEDPAGETTVAAVLPSAEELTSLGNLWVVVASRPGQHLERFLGGGAELVDLSDARFADDNRQFMHAYVRRALAEPEVKAAISAVQRDDLDLEELVLARAGHNPLYLDQFFGSVRSGSLPALMQGGLPVGLDAIHARLLDALAAGYGPGFVGQIRPALQVLAVARRPLRRAEMSRFTGLGDEPLAAALRVLQPYLDVAGPEPATTYALYHRAFQETLIAPAHQSKPWYVSSAAAHDRMSDVYWTGSSVNVDVLDEYGLEFLSAHLAAGGEEARRRLLQLPSRAWRRLRRRASGSHWPFLEDLRRVLGQAQALPMKDAIPAVARTTLVAGMLQDAERNVPAGALKATVRLGMLQRALDAVSPELKIEDQVARLTEIAAGLVALATSTAERSEAAELPDVYYRVFRQALDLLRREPSGFDLANLLKVHPLWAAATAHDLVGEAAEIVRRLPADWQRPRAVIELARVYTASDKAAASNWFRTALQDCLDQLRSSLTLEQERLVRYWSLFEPRAVAEILPRLRLRPDANSVRTVLHLGRALNADGATEALADLTVQAERNLLAAVQEPYERALCEIELGRARLELGEPAAAQAALARARQATGQIGTDQDPARDQQQRPRQGVDASIRNAGLAAALADPEAPELLERAWKAYAEHGSFNVDVEELVALQMTVQSSLLEVYLDGIAVFERQASARLAAVDALLDSPVPAHRALARRWLDKAQESAGQAVPSAWNGSFVYAAALAATVAHREQALQWVRARLEPDNEVALRLDLLRRLPVGDPHAPHWLRQTLELWSESSTNEHYVADLPTALVHLPVELTTSLLANPPQIADPRKRCYLMLALSVVAERRTAGSGRALLDEALKTISQAAGDRTPAALFEAYAAGLWWTLDPTRANELWTRALAWLNVGDAFERDPHHRHYWLMLLTRRLESGAPAAALQVYLSSPEPPVPAGSHFLVVPGAMVDAVIQAGLNERDWRLGLAAARSLASDPASPLREFIANVFPAATRALAFAGAAATGSAASRLRHAEAAMEAALQVEPPHLRWLLYARAVSAISALGAHQRAVECIPRGAEAILRELPVFGTVPMSAYAHALGLLVGSLLSAGEIGGASTLLFGAKSLGGEGVYRALAEVCKPFVAHAEMEGLAKLWDELQESENVMAP